MSIMQLGDVIQPEVFSGYVVSETMERSELCQAGIIWHDEALDALASGPNTLVNMPYLEDLDGESDVMTDVGELTPEKIGMERDVARKLARTKAWGATGLSAALSGADPMDAVAQRVADWWARDMQRMALRMLEGVFGAESMAGKCLDISGGTGAAAKWSGAAFVDANQLMGDAKERLSAVAMHSAVEAMLAKQALIEYETDGEKGVRVPVYMGKRVIVDDGLPFDGAAGLASVYLFGEGAFALGNGRHPRIVETEVQRNGMASSGEDYLVNRRVFLLHPRGVKWTETEVDGIFPTNDELADALNWTRVYEEKAIPMVKFTFKTA